MSASTFLQLITEILFILIFVIVAVRAVRQPQRVTIDTALLFGLASLLVAEGWVIALWHITPGRILTALTGSVLIALPYVLLRLVNDFAGISRSIMRAAGVGLGVLIVGLVVLADHTLPSGLTLFYVAYFTGVMLYSTVVVIRAASQSGGVTRRRLQAIAAGSLCLGLTILLAGVGATIPQSAAVCATLSNLMALGAGLGYVLAFAPPTWLRQAWQNPDLRTFLGHTARLSSLPDMQEMVQTLENGVATSFGASRASISLWDAQAGLLRSGTGEMPPELQSGESLGRRAFDAQCALFSTDVAPPNLVAHANDGSAIRAREVLAAPITAGEKRLGVLVVSARQAPLFAADDLLLLRLLADQIAVILENRVLLDEMARATRVKSEFLATMSHELRTPLNAIIGFSEVLYDGTFGELNTRQQRYISNVLESGRHLLGLVNDILDLSKVEAGRMELSREDVDLHQVLADACRVVRPLAQQKEIDLRLEWEDLTDAHDNRQTAIPSELRRPLSISLSVDRTRFVQILYNLLSNALKFTPTGGTVILSATLQSDAVAITVADSGIGIAPEDQERIFEAFQQVDSSAVRAQQGTGLGLALTRRLIELHGGTLTVESSLGQGSKFTITMPHHTRSVDAVPGIRGEVLVVEDQKAAGELLSLYLIDAGYGMTWVTRDIDVLPQARLRKPAAITLDIILDGKPAWHVLEQLKADPATCDIPVVIVSILDEQATGFALGASTYLVKPVGRQDLLAALQAVVGIDQPLQVLAVDDQPEALDLIALALEGSSYRLTRASSGEEALQLLAAQRPDVLIVDLMMAPISGFDVIAAVVGNTETQDIPIIVLTGHDLTENERARLTGRCLTIVPKRTFSRAQFLGELQRAIRTKESQKDHPTNSRTDSLPETVAVEKLGRGPLNAQ